MGYVLLGHGIFSVDPAVIRPGMELVALPEGTTLQFYSDAGQELFYGAEELEHWERLPRYLTRLSSREVTYNFALGSAPEDWDTELRNNPRFGGDTLIRPGVNGYPDPVPLCDGDSLSCPTAPDLVAAGMEHDCTGLLGLLRGDLHWVACTELDRADPRVVAAAMGGVRRGVLLGEDPCWMPDAAALRAVARTNRAALEATADGETLQGLSGSTLLIIAPGVHDPKHVNYALYTEDSMDIRITVYKENGQYSEARLDLRDVPEDRKAAVRAAIADSTNTRVRFPPR